MLCKICEQSNHRKASKRKDHLLQHLRNTHSEAVNRYDNSDRYSICDGDTSLANGNSSSLGSEDNAEVSVLAIATQFW